VERAGAPEGDQVRPHGSPGTFARLSASHWCAATISGRPVYDASYLHSIKAQPFAPIAPPHSLTFAALIAHFPSKLWPPSQGVVGRPPCSRLSEYTIPRIPSFAAIACSSARKAPMSPRVFVHRYWAIRVSQTR
jgi:hypothetical protein